LNTADLQDYLKRLDFAAPPDTAALEPTLPTLHALHRAQMLAVPFEDLSIHYGQPIVLEEAALFEKIVRRRRGGFCYELNGLFAALLRHLGYHVTLLSAGVFHSDGNFGPEFDHLTLLVHRLSGADWLADVGFGDSFVQPLRFEEGLEQDGGDGRRYRLARAGSSAGGSPAGGGDEGDYWMMQQFNGQGRSAADPGGRGGDNGEQWEAQYRFTLQPRVLGDFSERCHYFQTSPESHFVQNRICSLATPEGRVTLSGLNLITTVNGKKAEQALPSEEAYRDVLAERFGIRL
jgi:N-hydroxyarylamine O-acetyltransferase